jgi:hypothetical protein
MASDAIPFRDRISCTVDQATAATGLGRTTLYAAIGDGRVQTSLVGTRRLVSVPSLLQFINGSTESAPKGQTAA